MDPSDSDSSEDDFFAARYRNKIPNMNKNSPSMSIQSGSEIIKNLKRPPLDELSGESEKKIKKNQNSVEESSSDVPSNPNPEVKIDTELLEGLRNGKKDSIQTFLSIILKVFTQKDNTHEQFDSIINQKICEYLNKKSDVGRKCLDDLQLLIERETKWKANYSSLSQTVEYLTRVVMEQEARLKESPYSVPFITTRNVGLQVNLKPKEDERLNIRTPVKPTTVNSATSTDTLIPEIVCLSDDDDEVIPIEELDESKPSTSHINIMKKIPPKKRPAQLSTVTNSSTLNSRKLQTSGSQVIFKNDQLIPVQLSVAPMVTTPQQIQPRAVQPRAPSAFNRQPAPSLSRLQPVPLGIPLITQHPAPLPPSSTQRIRSSWKKLPPAPELTLSRHDGEDQLRGLNLTWTIKNLSNEYAKIKCFQIYSYLEMATEIPNTETWKKVSDVNALPLPMTCSLAQFITGGKYHFAVRAVDELDRFGPFSTPKCLFIV